MGYALEVRVSASTRTKWGILPTTLEGSLDAVPIRFKPRGILIPQASVEAQRLAEELEGLLEASSEPVLYFGDEPGPTWVTLWRDPVEAGLTLALALPFDDPDPVEHHISQMLTAGIGEDLVDPDDDQVLIAWQSEDIADGSDAEVATLLTLAVITAYQPAIHLSQCHWRGPEPSPEEVDQLRRRLAEPGIFADDCGLPTARIREVQTQAPSPPGHVGF